MTNPACEDFDYDGFLQECEVEIEKWNYSNVFLAGLSSIDKNTLSDARRKRSYGFRTAVGLSKILNVSIDKYVRAL